ncbi:LOW QUALITY PROTEIN: xanthine and CO dehydrogenases maturation factor, XdhC/CoxF family [Psychrobacter sp. JCM 18902]|nr:LOW QUALITY PROTEIN: xanthine and CO dehydrogenases maturation factor, XdhC/CoxF family [Psychrobacter sp. JCM 18902]
MNQIADILKLAREAQQQNVDAVLATVVRTEGSAYRRAGAMMLICEDGRSVGMISGGCLEPHIIKRAFWLTRNGANVQVYQTGDDIEYAENGNVPASVLEEGFDFNRGSDNKGTDHKYDEQDIDLDELNFGLGCNGRVHVLFERLVTAMSLLNVISQVLSLSSRRQLIRSTIHFNNQNNPNSQLQIGLRLNLDNYIKSGKLTVIDANNSDKVISNASSTVIHAVESLSEYKLLHKNAEYVIVKDVNDNDDLATEWLIQRLQPQIRLLICGAGNDVMPLVTMAKLQDWHVTVVDSRAQYATQRRFPQADSVMVLALDDSDTLLKLSKNAAIALMSHSLSQDRARLGVLLEHANHYKYLGQLGPRYRTERLIEEISTRFTNPASLNLGIKKLHYPIGYKLGGDGPEALALGIMAQVNAVVHNQNLSAENSDTHLSNTNFTTLFSTHIDSIETTATSARAAINLS